MTGALSSSSSSSFLPFSSPLHLSLLLLILFLLFLFLLFSLQSSSSSYRFYLFPRLILLSRASFFASSSNSSSYSLFSLLLSSSSFLLLLLPLPFSITLSSHYYSFSSSFPPSPSTLSFSPLQLFILHLLLFLPFLLFLFFVPFSKYLLIPLIGHFQVIKINIIFTIMVICLSCDLTLTKAFTQPVKSSDSYTIAQLFPTFKNVTLWNKCVLTCRMQDSGHGGILALRAKTFSIDGTSVISTTGLGRLHIMLNCNLMLHSKTPCTTKNLKR